MVSETGKGALPPSFALTACVKQPAARPHHRLYQSRFFTLLTRVLVNTRSSGRLDMASRDAPVTGGIPHAWSENL
jgi:hypothetical protein